MSNKLTSDTNKEIKLKLSIGEINLLLFCLAYLAGKHLGIEKHWVDIQPKIFKQMIEQIPEAKIKEDVAKILKENKLDGM